MTSNSAAGPPLIGPYEVFGRLHDGREAAIWAATFRGPGGFARSVAIKCLKPGPAARGDMRRSFLYEAALGGTIDHPGVTQVLDVGVWDGRPFFVTELVRGWPLRSVIATAELTRTLLPLDAVLHIAHAAAESLHYLHELRGPGGRPLGMIHRAIDDTNLLVARAGFVKLIDFGLAVPSASEQPMPLRSREATDFTAPELVGRRPIDRRADVFGLGVLIENLARQVGGGCPDDLRAVIDRAAAPKPRDRFSSARDLQRSIEAVAMARDLWLSTANTRRYLEQLFAPAPRARASSLPGLDDVRRIAPRVPVPNGGRTRVRVTRGTSHASGMRSMPVRRRRLSTGC